MVKRKSKRKISKRKISKRKSLKNRRYTKKGLINKIGGTGIMLDANDRVAYNTFINNSTFQFLTKGASGVSILAKFQGEGSPYRNLDESDYGGEVRTILIKLIAQNMTQSLIRVYDGADKTVIPQVRTETKTSIVSELNIQTDIALKTMNYLEPICPVPVWYENSISREHLEQMILNSEDGKTSDVLNAIKNNIDNKNVLSFSVIAMEFADNYKTLSSVYNLDYFYMAAYIILKLAIDTGYAHGDYHTSNIMIHPTKTNYFKGKTGAPLLIDFGYASKIKPDILTNIKQFVNNKQYTDALKLIGTIPRSDGDSLSEYPSYYEYLYDKFEPDANEKIDELFRLRDEAIQDTITKFGEMHDKNASIPLLPLSNNAKNKIYSATTVHNTIITINYYVTQAKITAKIFDWIYEVIIFETKRTPTSLEVILDIFGQFCYNYIYIEHKLPELQQHYNNDTSLTIQIYALAALNVVNNFRWREQNEDYKFHYIMSTHTNPRSSESVKKLEEAFIDVYRLFENIEIKSYANLATEYAINRIRSKGEEPNPTNVKPEIIKIYTNKNFYKEPMSLLCDSGTEISAQDDTAQDDAVQDDAVQDDAVQDDIFGSRVPGLPSCTISG